MGYDYSYGVTEDPTADTPAATRAGLTLLTVAVLGLGVGILACFAGHGQLYGISREVPWGLLTATATFCGVTSVGLLLTGVLIHAFQREHLEGTGNRSLFLALVTMLGAVIATSLSFESPWRALVFLVTSPNIASNIFWMAWLYAVATGCLFMQLYLIVVGRPGAALGFGAFGFLVALGATNSLGAFYATASARPFWHGIPLGLYFLGSAVMSGAAATVLATWGACRIRHAAPYTETFRGVQFLSRAMVVAAVLMTVALFGRFSAVWRGEDEMARRALEALLLGPLAANFWVLEMGAGLVLPVVVLLVTRFQNLKVMAGSALMLLVGAFFHRYDFLLAGEIVPQEWEWDALLPLHSYVPTIAEFFVAIGLLSGIGAGFFLGERFLGRIFR